MTSAKARSTKIVRDQSTGRIAKFVPTAEQRQLVKNLAGIGCTNEELLHCIPWGRPDGTPISERTLRTHFAVEIARGSALKRMSAKRKAYEMAIGGDRTMLIFFLKTQCGWSETLKVENTGKEGAPLPPTFVQPILYLPQKDPIGDDSATAHVHASPTQAGVAPMLLPSAAGERMASLEAVENAADAQPSALGSIGKHGSIWNDRADQRSWHAPNQK